MSEKPKMPLVIAKNRAATEIKRAINSICSAYELPFFELEDIIYRIGCEVREGAERELREASAAYKQAMDAYNNAQHQDGGEEEKKLSAPVIEVV